MVTLLSDYMICIMHNENCVAHNAVHKAQETRSNVIGNLLLSGTVQFTDVNPQKTTPAKD